LVKKFYSQSKRFYLFFLIGIPLISFISMPCFGMETGYSKPVFSLTVKNQPLKQALQNISKSTGYKITVSKGWEYKQLTAVLEAVPLEEGLNKIIKLIGNPNHAIVKNEKQKTVEIKILDLGSNFSTKLGLENILLKDGQSDTAIDKEMIPSPVDEVKKDVIERKHIVTRSQLEEGQSIDPEMIPAD
jgi:hypothetical protein